MDAAIIAMTLLVASLLSFSVAHLYRKLHEVRVEVERQRRICAALKKEVARERGLRE